MTMTADPGGQVLYGDWRRRRLTKTDAHLYRDPLPGDTLSACRKRIPYDQTVTVHRGRPCTDCLVAEITRRP